jgi:hypothetical protein
MSMTVRRFGSIALGVALTTLAPALHADPDTYDTRLVRAVAAKEHALDADDTAHWQEALSAFQAADALRDTAEALYEIGYAAQRLKQIDLAVEAYGGAIELGLPGPARDKAAEYVAAHTPETASLKVVGPSGTAIRVNGLLRGTLPLRRPLVVLAGHTTLEASSGQARWSRDLDLSAGTHDTADITQAAPQADTPAMAPPPPPRETAPAPPVPGPTVSEPPPAPSKTGAWVLIGSGAALTVVSAILLPVSNAHIDASRRDLEISCAIPNGSDACFSANPGYEQAAQDQVDSIATYKAARTGAWIGLGAGSVALVTGIALAAHASAARPAHRATTRWDVDIVPLPFPALSLRGTF